MKVIKKGNPNPQWHMKVECSYCRALLEIEAGDIHWKGRYVPRHSHDVDGDLVSEDYGVHCPECRAFVILKKKNIPSDIRSQKRPWDV